MRASIAGTSTDHQGPVSHPTAQKTTVHRNPNLSITTDTSTRLQGWRAPRLPTPRYRSLFSPTLANTIPPVPRVSFFEADTPTTDEMSSPRILSPAISFDGERVMSNSGSLIDLQDRRLSLSDDSMTLAASPSSIYSPTRSPPWDQSDFSPTQLKTQAQAQPPSFYSSPFSSNLSSSTYSYPECLERSHSRSAGTLKYTDSTPLSHSSSNRKPPPPLDPTFNLFNYNALQASPTAFALSPRYMVPRTPPMPPPSRGLHSSHGTSPGEGHSSTSSSSLISSSSTIFEPQRGTSVASSISSSETPSLSAKETESQMHRQPQRHGPQSRGLSLSKKKLVRIAMRSPCGNMHSDVQSIGWSNLNSPVRLHYFAAKGEDLQDLRGAMQERRSRCVESMQADGKGMVEKNVVVSVTRMRAYGERRKHGVAIFKTIMDSGDSV